MSAITHKLFLDDSGNKEYSPDGTYVSKGRTPYFVFGGLLVRPEVAGKISVDMEALKAGTFGTPDVEVKANWLKRPAERRKRYLDPFHISDAALDHFINELYTLICAQDADLIACVVNKAEVQEQYGLTSAWYAPAIAYECVMQRAQLAMLECDGHVHVTVDDMEGKSPKGNDWKENLKRHHKQLRANGSQLRRGMPIDRLVGESPAFRDSAHDDRLQLADLVSYSVYRQFVDHGADWEGELRPLPVYDYFSRLCKKFRSGEGGRIQGYGIVKFPLKRRVRWAVKP